MDIDNPQFIEEPEDVPVDGTPLEPEKVIDDILRVGRDSNQAVVSILSDLVIGIRHMLRRPGRKAIDLVRIAARATGIPVLVAGDMFWWAPAQGETWHPTTTEFLEHCRALPFGQPAERPQQEG